MSSINDIGQVDVGRTVTVTYSLLRRIKAFNRCMSSAKAKPHPPGASGIAEFGNNDPAENFEKRNIRHARAVRAQNSEGVLRFFSSSVSIRRWTYVRYCRSAMAQKLFSTGPGGLRRAERKETIDDLERTSCDNLFHSEMVLGKNENL